MDDGLAPKYDRQVRFGAGKLTKRLWQTHGQQALQRASVCLLQATAAGAETMKNLVLAGISSFVVVDERQVNEHDVENSFFVTRAAIGESRAKAVCELLAELNGDVHGIYVLESVDTLVTGTPQYFAQFDLVVCAGAMRESTLLKVDSACWRCRVPLLRVQACGFAGLLRVVAESHHVVETHPEAPVTDLRLTAPWAELRVYVENLKPFEEMDGIELAHVPYPLVLLRLKLDFTRSNDRDISEGEFGTYLDMRRAALEAKLGCASDAFETWDEARRKMSQLFTQPPLARSVLDIFDRLTRRKLYQSPHVDGVIDASRVAAARMSEAAFFAMARAVRDFYDANGYLPISGTLPDFKADTRTFVDLQRIYRAQAQRDLALVRGLLEPSMHIADELLALFCRNAASVFAMQTTSLRTEHTTAVPPSSWRADGEHNAEMAIYLAFRARDKLLDSIGHSDELPLGRLKSALREICKSASSETEHWLAEFSRSGNIELGVTASAMGGFACQEAIKLLTAQFTPMHGTFIYNGIGATSHVFPDFEASF